MRVRRHVPRERRRGDGRRDEYAVDTNIETQRGEHNGRRTRQLPGTNEKQTVGPSGAGAYAGGTIPAVPTMLQSRR